MTADDPTAIARHVFDALTRHDLTLIDAHPGLAESRAAFGQMLAAFPDLQATVQEQFTDGEWVATRAMLRGTHQPTGKAAVWEAIHLHRIVDGAIVRQHSQADVLGCLGQLGLAPDLSQAK